MKALKFLGLVLFTVLVLTIQSVESSCGCPSTPSCCTQEWKCYDSTHKAYQHSDCSWTAKEYCRYGCEDGYCKQSSCTNYCDDNYDVNVKEISLNPNNPKRCENVLVNVPIELKEAPKFPQYVYVKAYIDNNLEYTTSIKYYDEEIRVFKFTFDSCDYNTGAHSIRVEAKLDGVKDTSTKSFTIIDDYYYEYKSHCIDVEKIWTNKPIQPDEDVQVYAKITNCGTEFEPGMRANLEAFDMIIPDGMFNLPKGGSQEISFNLHVPEDAAGTEPFVVRTWSSYTSDVLVKEFTVYTGIPLIDVEPVHEVEKGKIEKIEFDVINVGEVTDTFTLELSGYASNWMTGMKPEVTLEPEQRETVWVYVNVPREVSNGDYQFTVAAEGSPRYAVTSTLRVVERFSWPSFTGLFVGIEGCGWLPCLLLLLLLIPLLVWWLLTRKTSRRGGPEKIIRNFFKFDDCC